MGEHSPHHLLEWRTELRGRILPRTELRVGDRIPQVFRSHIGKAHGGVVETAIRRIAESAQDAVDFDDVVGGLDVQAGEKIA